MSNEDLKELEMKCLQSLVDGAKYHDDCIEIQNDSFIPFLLAYLENGVTEEDEGERLIKLWRMFDKKQKEVVKDNQHE